LQILGGSYQTRPEMSSPIKAIYIFSWTKPNLPKAGLKLTKIHRSA